MFIYFWEEIDRAWAGKEKERGDTESETGSRLWAVSTEPHAGLELTDREIMTWAKVGRWTDWAIQAPHIDISKMLETTWIPWEEERLNKVWYIHTMECYTAVENNEEDLWKRYGVISRIHC